MALTDNLIFLSSLQVDSFPTTDEIGGLTISAVGGANVQAASPGPAGHTSSDGDCFVTSVLPAWAYPFTMGVTWRQPSASRPVTQLTIRLTADNYFQIYMNNSFALFARARSGGTASDAPAPVAFTYANDTWYSAVAVFTSSSSTKLFVSGAFGTTDTTSVSPAGPSSPAVRIGANAADTAGVDSVIGFLKYAFIANRAWTLADCQEYESDPSLIAASGGGSTDDLMGAICL